MMLKKSEVKITFKTNNNLQKKEVKNKTEVELNCGNCNSVYTGETCRNIETRIKEHLQWFNLKTN